MSAGRARAQSVIRLLTVGVCGLMACASQVPSTPQGHTVSDQPTSLCGLWSDTRTWLRLGGDGRFRWEEPRPCDDPPCPWQVTEGQWRASEGALWLERSDGRGTHSLTWILEHTPRRLALESRRGPRWDLSFREP
jgi:hypothetical protein